MIIIATACTEKYVRNILDNCNALNWQLPVSVHILYIQYRLVCYS